MRKNKQPTLPGRPPAGSSGRHDAAGARDDFSLGRNDPIKVKDNYFDTNPWSNRETNPISTIKYNLENDILEAADDVAHVRLGGKRRMPTFDEMSQLATQCTWASSTIITEPEFAVIRFPGRMGTVFSSPFLGIIPWSFTLRIRRWRYGLVPVMEACTRGLCAVRRRVALLKPDTCLN